VPGELNQYSYYTEIEEYFWRKRGAHLLVSPLDWAILETWQKAGIPVAAVLAGIDRAFESFARSRRARGGRTLKSLAYCVDAVLDAAEQWKEAHAGENPAVTRAATPAAPFSAEELRRHLEKSTDALRRAADGSSTPAALHGPLRETAEKLAVIARNLAGAGLPDLQDLERRLTIFEEKLTAAFLSAADDALLLDLRRELDRSLAPYRRKMSAAQLGTLERQYLQKRLWERYAVPRLSLFYLT
jgi:hypothetical protein